jgi:hypothetical protein
VMRVFAGILVLAGGLIHLSQGPVHFREEFIYGVFFLGVGAAQLSVGFSLLAVWRSKLAYSGIALSLGVVAVWIETRLWGPPIGAGAGLPETIGFLDLAATLTEAVAALLLIAGLLNLRRATVTTGWRRTRIVALSAVWAAMVGSLAAGFLVYSSIDPEKSPGCTEHHGGERHKDGHSHAAEAKDGSPINADSC